MEGKGKGTERRLRLFDFTVILWKEWMGETGRKGASFRGNRRPVGFLGWIRIFCVLYGRVFGWMSVSDGFGCGESETNTQRERCGDAELIVSELRTVGRMDVLLG